VADEGEGPDRAERAGGRWSWQSWLGVGSMGIVGVVTGALILVFTLLVT
jgi:hypothetical protein